MQLKTVKYVIKQKQKNIGNRTLEFINNYPKLYSQQ